MALGLREHFLLRDDVVFLNNGSFGACPRPIFEDYQFWQLELEKQPVEFMDQHRRSLKLIRNVREQLGAFVGSHPNNLVGVTNATTGLNIVARSLPLQEGDEILTTDHEYGALEKTWTFIARKTGAKYIHADVPLPLASVAEFTAASPVARTGGASRPIVRSGRSQMKQLFTKIPAMSTSSTGTSGAWPKKCRRAPRPKAKRGGWWRSNSRPRTSG